VMHGGHLDTVCLEDERSSICCDDHCGKYVQNFVLSFYTESWCMQQACSARVMEHEPLYWSFHYISVDSCFYCPLMSVIHMHLHMVIPAV